MDFTLTDDQQGLLDAVGTLLSRHAGPERARALGGLRPRYDHDLEQALESAGFLDLHRSPDAGPLEAALVVEAVGRAAGNAAVGARALVAPGVTDAVLEPPIALAVAGSTAPVRFGAEARTVLLVGDGAEARVVPSAPGGAEPVDSLYGYPLARLGALPPGESLGPRSAPRLEAWWRVALAAEIAGAMRAALDITVAYVKERQQFGRAIGSFQGVQHRLAECAVLVEGTTWLAREAAWLGAPAEAAATAAVYAASAAHRLATDTHQLTGAIGLTMEYDLHVWTMRLQTLRLELGGVASHGRAVAASRWPVATP